MIDISDEVRNRLIITACSLPTQDLWQKCIEVDQKAHFCDLKQCFTWLAISFETNGDRQIGKLLNEKSQNYIKGYRDRFLAFYELVRIIWNNIEEFTVNPALIGYEAYPDGKLVKRIDFPFASPIEVIEQIMFQHSNYCMGVCFSDHYTLSGSSLRKMYRLDLDIRQGFHAEKLHYYEYVLRNNRRGFENYFSLEDFCLRIAKKISGQYLDVRKKLDIYQCINNSFDAIVYKGLRNAKGFGFANGQKIFPSKGGRWS